MSGPTSAWRRALPRGEGLCRGRSATRYYDPAVAALHAMLALPEYAAQRAHDRGFAGNQARWGATAGTGAEPWM